MKQWKAPRIDILMVTKTAEFDSSNSHYCHNQGGNCSDVTNGVHSNSNHTYPNWFDNHEPSNNCSQGHTCCCSELVSMS